jgi:AcrR family transcriptional regulator
MSTRPYRLGRRAETANETRRRLVQATFDLHREQGIAATSMKQIAERAGVSVGTVYHHFPSYQDAVEACGRHIAATWPLPTSAIFTGADTLAERVRRLVGACFSYFDQLPWFEPIRAEFRPLAPVVAFVEREEANRVALMGEALKPLKIDLQQVRSAAALIDPAVHRALRRARYSTSAAADEAAAFILARFGLTEGVHHQPASNA